MVFWISFSDENLEPRCDPYFYLFRHGYFDPCVELEVAYSLDNDMMAPVYRGNMIKPSEAAAAPEVSPAMFIQTFHCHSMSVYIDID